jgi:hypothetical protein
MGSFPCRKAAWDSGGDKRTRLYCCRSSTARERDTTNRVAGARSCPARQRVYERLPVCRIFVHAPVTVVAIRSTVPPTILYTIIIIIIIINVHIFRVLPRTDKYGYTHGTYRLNGVPHIHVYASEMLLRFVIIYCYYYDYRIITFFSFFFLFPRNDECTRRYKCRYNNAFCRSAFFPRSRSASGRSRCETMVPV